MGVINIRGECCIFVSVLQPHACAACNAASLATTLVCAVGFILAPALSATAYRLTLLLQFVVWAINLYTVAPHPSFTREYATQLLVAGKWERVRSDVEGCQCLLYFVPDQNAPSTNRSTALHYVLCHLHRRTNK